MRPGERISIKVDTLRDIRSECRYWFKHARRNGASDDICEEYLAAWATLCDLVLEVNH